MPGSQCNKGTSRVGDSATLVLRSLASHSSFRSSPPTRLLSQLHRQGADIIQQLTFMPCFHSACPWNSYTNPSHAFESHDVLRQTSHTNTRSTWVGTSSAEPFPGEPMSLSGHWTNPTKYVPILLDLVTPSRDAAKLIDKHIPPIFLAAEAVDSSVRLGDGASFAASLQKIPKGAERVGVTINFDQLLMTKSVPAPPRPEYIVRLPRSLSKTMAHHFQSIVEHRRAS